MIVKYLSCIALVSLAHGIEVEFERKAITKAGCSLNIYDGSSLPSPEPLLLKATGIDGLSFHLPNSNSSTITLSVGDVLRIGCSGENYFLPVGYGVREVDAICVLDSEFSVEGRHFHLPELRCFSDAHDTARFSPSKEKCFNDNIIAEIGFEVRTDFIKIIDICFDTATKNTLWTKYTLVSGIDGRQKDRTGNTDFLADVFYPGLSPPSLYSRSGQIATFERILGSADLVDKYINRTSGNFFLSHGHLVARADFVYFAQHIATYHYINVAPQWQTFNGGNWEKIETLLRLFAAASRVNLTVYTGTHGVTTLPNEAGDEQELWLHVDVNKNKAIPVPMLYWKVVYDELKELAVAIVGVNNPHIAVPQNETGYMICNDVCDQIKWLRLPTANDVTLGYTYCCEVDEEFRGVVKTLPVFNVTGLLSG